MLFVLREGKEGRDGYIIPNGTGIMYSSLPCACATLACWTCSSDGARPLRVCLVSYRSLPWPIRADDGVDVELASLFSIRKGTSDVEDRTFSSVAGNCEVPLRSCGILGPPCRFVVRENPGGDDPDGRTVISVIIANTQDIFMHSEVAKRAWKGANEAYSSTSPSRRARLLTSSFGS